MHTTIKQNGRGLVAIVIATGLLLAQPERLSAAVLTAGYVPESGLLSPMGEVLFIDRGATGGGDATSGGNPAFSVEVANIWTAGEDVRITGIALPLHASGTSDTTLNGTMTFSFYDLDGGANPDAFDGLAAETLVGTATAAFEGNGTTGTSAYYVIFDDPITFTAASSGIAVRIQHSTSLRLKINSATPEPRAVRKSNTNGSTFANNPDMRISLAGTVGTPKRWYGDKGTAWDTTSLNWDEGTAAYEEGDSVLFDDTTVNSSPVTVNLTGERTPADVLVSSSKAYVLTGQGIGGAASLKKQGAGTLTLSQLNSYSGKTIVNEGRLAIGVNDAVPGGAGKGIVTVAQSGTLDLNGHSATVNGLGGAGNVDNTAPGQSVLTVVNDAVGSTFSGAVQNTGGTLSLAKSGTNVLTLTGLNSHTGATIVREGTLALQPASAHSATSALIVSNAAVVRLDVSNGQTLSAPGLALGGGTVAVVYGNLNHSPFGLTAADVTGQVTLSGVNRIALLGTNFALGVYPVISFSSIAGSGAFDPVPDLPAGVYGSVETNGSSIVVNVTALARSLTWYGGAGSSWTAPGNWNSGADSYQDYGTLGDRVIFDDSLDGGTLNTNVTVPVPVRPGTLTVNNSTYDYSLDGAGKITGATALTKQGAANLTLGTANDYTGGSVLQAGTVRLAHDTGLGSGRITLAGGAVASGTLSARTLNNAVLITGPSGLGETNSGTLQISGLIDFSGGARNLRVWSDTELSGVLTNGSIGTKSGSASLRLTSNNLQSGGNWQIGDGSLVVDGATVQRSEGGIRIACQVAGGTSRFVVTNGGTVLLQSGLANARIGLSSDFAGDPSATNILDVSGTLTVPGFMRMGASSAFAQCNLRPGAVLAVSGFQHEGNVTEINVDGATIVPTINNASFLQGLSAVNVLSGGVIVEVEGVSIGIGQNLIGGQIGGLTKTGTGTLNLNGTASYKGQTMASAGTLGGSGTLDGAIVVGAAARLSPGVGIGTLTTHSNATLAGDVLIEINKGIAPAHDVLDVAGVLAYGGTLTATNVGSVPLQAGDSFHVFRFGSQTGSIALQGTPGPGLAWSFDEATGVLSVISTVSGPVLNAPTLSGTHFILTGTGGTEGSTYSVLAATNVAQPLNEWVPVSSGVFGSAGSFSNGVPLGGEPKRFFRLQIP
jgi:fibronectin-binding autotransporter adhesin